MRVRVDSDGKGNVLTPHPSPFTAQVEVAVAGAAAAAAEGKSAQLEEVVAKLTAENKALKDDKQYLQDSLSHATTQLGLVKEELLYAAGSSPSANRLLLGGLLLGSAVYVLRRNGISLATLIFGQAK